MVALVHTFVYRNANNVAFVFQSWHATVSVDAMLEALQRAAAESI